MRKVAKSVCYNVVLTLCVSCADGEQVTIGKAQDRHHTLYSHLTVTARMHRFYILIQPPFDTDSGTNYMFTPSLTKTD